MGVAARTEGDVGRVSEPSEADADARRFALRSRPSVELVSVQVCDALEIVDSVFGRNLAGELTKTQPAWVVRIVEIRQHERTFSRESAAAGTRPGRAPTRGVIISP
jgi:hypothetical protein